MVVRGAMAAARLVRSSLLIPFGSAWSHTTAARLVSIPLRERVRGAKTAARLSLEEESPSGVGGALSQQDEEEEA